MHHVDCALERRQHTAVVLRQRDLVVPVVVYAVHAQGPDLVPHLPEGEALPVQLEHLAFIDGRHVFLPLGQDAPVRIEDVYLSRKAVPFAVHLDPDKHAAARGIGPRIDRAMRRRPVDLVAALVLDARSARHQVVVVDRCRAEAEIVDVGDRDRFFHVSLFFWTKVSQETLST